MNDDDLPPFAQLLAGEEELRFSSFTNDDAWALGCALVEAARARQAPVAIDVTRNGQELFQHTADGGAGVAGATHGGCAGAAPRHPLPGAEPRPLPRALNVHRLHRHGSDGRTDRGGAGHRPWVLPYHPRIPAISALHRLKAAGVEPRAQISPEDFLAIPHLVRATDLIGLVPARLAGLACPAGVVCVAEVPVELRMLVEAL